MKRLDDRVCKRLWLLWPGLACLALLMGCGSRGSQVDDGSDSRPTSVQNPTAEFRTQNGAGPDQTYRAFKPVNVSATHSGDGITVSWQRSLNATHFVITRREQREGRWELLPLVKSTPDNSNFFSIVDTDVDSGKTYVYGIQTWNFDSRIGALVSSETVLTEPVTVP